MTMTAPGSTVTSTFNPQMANIPSSYQPQGPAPAQHQMDGSQLQAAPVSTASYNMPPASMVYTDQGLPSMGQPSMPYSMPPTMDYNSFNMQSELRDLVHIPGLAVE